MIVEPPRLWLPTQPPPDSATLMKWRLEAGRAGFSGEQGARLAFWRWLAEVDRAGLGNLMDNKRFVFLDHIRAYFGKPYVFGGKTPETSFDCSGLLTHCGIEVGLDLGNPYYTSADGLKAYCERIPLTHIAAGDLYLFSQTYGNTGPDYATHCGAATGDGTHMLDTHGDPWPGVGQTNILTPYWQQHLMGAWRPHGYNDDGNKEDPAVIAELEAKVRELESTKGYLTVDVANALQDALDGAAKARNKQERQEAYDSIQAAINTLRRGG